MNTHRDAEARSHPAIEAGRDREATQPAARESAEGGG
jgi:hypothetical protein